MLVKEKQNRRFLNKLCPGDYFVQVTSWSKDLYQFRGYTYETGETLAVVDNCIDGQTLWMDFNKELQESQVYWVGKNIDLGKILPVFSRDFQ